MSLPVVDNGQSTLRKRRRRGVSSTPDFVGSALMPNPRMDGLRLLIFFLFLGICIEDAACRWPLSPRKSNPHPPNFYRPPATNTRPLIGVLSQPGDIVPEGYRSWLSASYVKWLEAGGARVVPIFFEVSNQEVANLFNVVNALVIPGLAAVLAPGHKFYDTAAFLLGLAIKANDAGDYFPVHGVGLGLELMATYFSANYTLLTKMDRQPTRVPIKLTKEGRSSYLTSFLPPSVVENLETLPLTLQDLPTGVPLQSMQDSKVLQDAFTVVSTSTDRSNRVFVSTLEAKQYPFTATHWQPQKSLFEWNPQEDIPHSLEAVQMAQSLSNFVVNEARRNRHRARDIVQEDEIAVYNWCADFYGRHYTPDQNRAFEQVYFFAAAESTQHLASNSTPLQTPSK